MYDKVNFEDDEEDAAETEITNRQEQYQAALYTACDILDPTSSEAESVRGRSNSI